jgi:uracil phosphoribosyltransferase
MTNYSNQENKREDLKDFRENNAEMVDREADQIETNFYSGVNNICSNLIGHLQDSETQMVIQGIAAESASGKGYLLEEIVKRLEEQGFSREKILLLSTDNYYKGISQMTLERISKSHQMPELLGKDKVQSLKNIIGNRYFGFKFGNGINEQGAEISDQDIMKDLYSRLFKGSSLDKNDIDRLEWALKEILAIPKDDLQKYNFNDTEKIKNSDLADILISNGFTEEKFIEAFSKVGVMEQVKNALSLEPTEWESIRSEFNTNQLNFDEPEAVDLNKLSNDLKKLKETGEIVYPIYSMKVSEPVDEVKASKKEIVLLEGIYALNDKIINELDEKAYLKTDRVHQLVRRFIRDIFIEKRSSYDPWLLLFIMSNFVFPGAQKYVVPDKEKASLVINNNFTEEEDDLIREKIIEKKQIKYQLNKIQFNTLKKKLVKLGLAPFKHDQIDFYVADGENNERLLRIRVIDGKLSSIQYQGKPKVSGQIISRPFINLCQEPIPNYLPYQSEAINDGGGTEKMIYDLVNSGFHVSNVVEKQRLSYELDGVQVNLDEIVGLNYFLEIRGENEFNEEPIKNVIKKLNINLDKKTIADSYYDLKKVDLNDGKVAEDVEGSYVKIESTPEIDLAFEVLRKGYPNESLENQTKGPEFREASDVIISTLVEKSLEILPKINRDQIVVVLPWRSALAFAENFVDSGVTNFYHLSSKRIETTLHTEVTYESGELSNDSYVIIADPMLATGNTITDTIIRVKNMGIPEDHILVVSVLAAPIGVYSVLDKYNEVKVLLGVLDKDLTSTGYISPGLGDFGDKYFADFIDNPEKVQAYLRYLLGKGILKEADSEELLKRFLGEKKNVINNSLNQIIESTNQVSNEKEESESDSQLMLEKLTGEEKKVVQGYFFNHPELTFEETKNIIEDIIDHRGSELELRFLVPKNDVQGKIEDLAFDSLVQVYFPKDQWNTILNEANLSLSDWQDIPLSTLRLREEKVDNKVKYILTAKSSKSIYGNGKESQKELDPEFAKGLLENTIEGKIIKNRYNKSINVDGLELKLQIDSFKEVRNSEEVAKNFLYYIVEVEVPGDFAKDILLKTSFDSDYYIKGASVSDITGKNEYSNYSLATQGFPSSFWR